MTKKLLPKIKAISPETAEVLEADARTLGIQMNVQIFINDERLDIDLNDQYTNFFDALVDIRATLNEVYAFLNSNLGTHYVVKNDTESNLRDLGYLSSVKPD